MLFGMTSARADSYKKIATIALAKVPTSMDIGWVDPATQRYYVADRTNQAVDVIDTTTNKLLAQIGGFVGDNAKAPGPNGVLVIPETQEVWAGDGDSTVKVIDVASRKIVATIPTGGKGRANESAYDPRDHIFMIGNDRDDVPFLTFISTDTRQILGKIDFPDAADEDGIHQPVWNPADGLFYMSTPAT
jgi:YVTN family beta-propeller protein